MLPAMAAPSCYRTGEFLPGYAMEAGLWRKVTNLEVCWGASALVSRMESTARGVRMARINGKLPEPDGSYAVKRNFPGALVAALC